MQKGKEAPHRCLNNSLDEKSIPSGIKWMQEGVWNLIGRIVAQVVKLMIEELLKEEVKEAVEAEPSRAVT